MRRLDSHGLLAMCLVACLALSASCGGGDEESSSILPARCARVGNPDFNGPGRGAIGPSGGTVEETDPTSPIGGVSVYVAPGMWSECWEIRISYATMFSTPDYPTGYVPFERPGPSGAVEIEIGLSTTTGFYRNPDPLPIEISFPMERIKLGTLDVRSAYFFDHTKQTWRIVLPDEVTRERLTVKTTAHLDLWSWGRVDLGEVDYEQHMKPALEAYYGAETLADIRSALDAIRAQALQQRWQLTCAGLAAAEGFFAGARDGAAGEIDRIQASLHCGACNPLTEKFQQELDEWWSVKQWGVALDFAGIISAREPADVLQLALTPLIKNQQEWVQCVFDPVGCIIDEIAPDTDCDYECYFKKVPFQMNVQRAAYYGCDWARGIVDRYRTQQMNPPCR